MSDTTKPWAAEGLTAGERTNEVIKHVVFDRSTTMVTVLEAIMAAETQALADAAPRWISVKERLPWVYKNVILCAGSGYVFMGFWTGEIFLGQDGSPVSVDIPFWQPLPAPPQEEE